MSGPGISTGLGNLYFSILFIFKFITRITNKCYGIKKESEIAFNKGDEFYY